MLATTTGSAMDTSSTVTVAGVRPRLAITSKSGDAPGADANIAWYSPTLVVCTAWDESSVTDVNAPSSPVPVVYHRRPPANPRSHTVARPGAAKLPVFSSVVVSITSIIADPQRATYSVEPSSTMPPAPLSPAIVLITVPSPFTTTMLESVAGAPVTNV